ncbi:MAG: hypothetical protein EHM63_04510, partial [Actinobacteria bacterium]
MASQVTSPEAAEAPPARRAVGLQIFASAEDEPRTRRSTDVVVAVANASIVVIAALTSRLLAGLEASFAEVVANVPGFFDTVWRLLFWPAVVWSIVLLIVAVVRGRLALARDLLLAVVLSVLGVAAVAAIVMEDPPGLTHLLFGSDGPPVFPPGLVVVAAAVISTGSPHLTRPFRRLGSWLTGFQVIGAIMLGAALPSGAAAAVALGLLVAAAVHLAVGSPGGWPTASRIQLALADLGVEVDDLTSASVHREGIALFEATDDGGPLLVKVYGRDAGDAQYLASLWRRLWYRGAERPTAQSRIELVEHEGLVTLLAERAGARVPLVVTAGGAGQGDALVVVRPLGDAVQATGGTLTGTDEAAVS